MKNPDQSEDEREFDWVSKRYGQKRFFAREAKHGSRIINQLMARKGYGQTNAASKLDEQWSAAVGTTMASKSRAVGIKQNSMQVIVENSSVMQALTFDKRQIIKKLRAGMTTGSINDIRFKVGPVN